jgi:hypothetical protein
MTVTNTADLNKSIQRLFPNIGRDEALVQLLMERAQRNLVRYQAAARGYVMKYGQDFESFRQATLSSDPDEATEQDYFDWELAVTGLADMQDEIARLRELFES